MKYNLETFKTLKFVVIAIPTLVGRSNPIGASIYPATRAGGIASSLRLPAAGRLLAMTCNFVFQKSHLTILLLFLFVFVSVSSAQTDEQTIRNVLNDQVEAWNRGDIEGYMKGYWNSDSTVFNSGGTLTRGYSNVLARYNGLAQRQRRDWRDSILIIAPLPETRCWPSGRVAVHWSRC